MKIIRKLLWWIAGLLVLGNLLIVVTENSHLYKAIANTYLKGRSGPSIDEYTIFANREIKTGMEQPWQFSRLYNTQSIADSFLKEFEKYQTVAFLVIERDSILHEQYWEEYSDSSITNSFSMAKSIVSILTGIAIDEGKIKSVHQHVGDFIPSFQAHPELTVAHLLTMSSGINFDESYANPFGFAAKGYYGNDLKKLIGEYEITEVPGKNFQYKSGNTVLLAMLLEKAIGQNLSGYASEKLWKPIGAKQSAFWSLDHADGIEKAYCCFNSNARDFARLGKLYFNKGKWDEKQIVSEQYVAASVQPADMAEEDGTPNDCYGYSWWLLHYRDNPIFYARGISGQYIIVLPEQQMIVVRLGRQRANSYPIPQHPSDVFVYIDAALELVSAKYQ